MNARKPLPSYDAPEPIIRQAGAWLARKDRGFTANELDEFNRWVREDALHAAAVAQLERTMLAFDRLRVLAPSGATPNSDAFAPTRARLRWFLAAATGIAAALAVVVWSGRLPSTPSTWEYATSAGGYQRATLLDGSTVELNTDTRIEIEFTARERRVRLASGEAHFQVAKDPARPFVVQAKSVSVSAVGTAFNVRLATAGVEVLVTEGKVRVAPPAPPGSVRSPQPTSPSPPSPDLPLLTAGHKVMVATAARTEPTKIAAVSPEEIQRALAWQPRVAEFNKTPLSAVVAEFNRQNRQQIVIQHPELQSLRIGGNFRTDQPEAFVRLLETSFGIAVERSGPTLTLRKAANESR